MPKRVDERYLSPVVCGDFNSRSGKPMTPLRTSLNTWRINAPTSSTRKTGAPSRHFLPIHGLDFILVPPSYKVLCAVRSYAPTLVTIAPSWWI